MSSGCEFEKYFDDYFFGDLSPAEDLALQKHLQTCQTCPEKMDNHYRIHARLKKYHRPSAPIEAISAYHKEINLGFNNESFKQRFILWINRYLKRRTLFARVAQFASLLIIGIVVGWFVFSPAEPEIVFPAGDRFPMSRPISNVDLDYVHYYLLASEMVLLEIENSDPQNDFILNRELAQKLLIKTFRVHEIALQLNNLRLLNFLSRMELLLHEVSNLSDEEISESLDTIVKAIEEADLLREVKTLKTVIKQEWGQSGT
jgi:hypothetical protein